MNEDITNLKLLLVDDEDDFRLATSKTLSRRGFTVAEAANGADAITAIRKDRPDVVLLDLKMPGLSGIETLQKIRELEKALPVIILTGHGDFQDAMAGIKLEIVDFLQKPVDVDQLSQRIRSLLEQGEKRSLRERTIAELMKPPSLYPRFYIDEPVVTALETLKKVFLRGQSEDKNSGQIRSALVYDRNDKFLGLVRFPDLLKLVLPSFLEDSPYTTYFTGMFLAQCKVIGTRNIRELMDKHIFVSVYDPVMKAVHLMVKHHLITLPVMMDDELVGILRERDIILEIAGSLGTLN
ncbi:MAG: response regulator [Candidatus Hatepunaea meridiana]|nr:response regulator [Candidatus Hatepunaea meridiana]